MFNKLALRVLAVVFLLPGFTAAELLALDRPVGSAGDLTLETKHVTLKDGTTAAVEAGVLLVPENRELPGGPVISIPFYRLRSHAARPAAPIFLLAGGPGSSWIDRFERRENFEEVQFYRQIADVVLFDQRGAGHSTPTLTCDERDQMPLDRPLDLQAQAARWREMAVRCRDRWLAAGVDLAAYNTRENAADVLALRSALGYDRITLIGGSYGSHLALALMRTAPAAVDRAVLYGIEGPDHTWDDPSARLAVYERIAGAAEYAPALAGEIPQGGLLETLRSVIDKLEKAPVTVEVEVNDELHRVVLDATLLRAVAGFQAGRRSRPEAWPRFLLDLHRGEYSLLARGAMALRTLRLDHPMHYMMDCGSGISNPRRARIQRSAATALLGDINREYEVLCPIWGAPDLGPGFRSPVTTDTPTLLLHGTWDTSTPIENAREVAAALPGGHLVEVIGGTHGALYNLLESWPPMRQRLAAFLRGESVHFPSSVTLPPPEFTPPSEARDRG